MTVRTSEAIRTKPCSSNRTPAIGIASFTGQMLVDAGGGLAQAGTAGFYRGPDAGSIVLIR